MDDKTSSTERVLDGRRQPIDRVAARVIGNGVGFSPCKKILTGDQRTPIECRSILNVQHEHRWLVGHKFGRFTVIGLSFKTGGHGALWAVRCACGIYSYRTAKAIRNPRNNVDKCEECRHLEHLKDKDVFRRTGRDRA